MSARRPRQGGTPEARDIRGAAELAVLVRELEHTAPACTDDDRYVTEPDALLPGAIDLITDICQGWPRAATTDGAHDLRADSGPVATTHPARKTAPAPP